jgi:peptide/nickel transport system permease protein
MADGPRPLDTLTPATPAGGRPGPADGARRASGRSQLRLIARRFGRHRLAMASAVAFLAIVLFAFAGPSVWPYGHAIDFGVPSNSRPSLAHPFGTTQAGHDVFGQVMRGTQQSLKVALTVSLLTTTIGSIWGAVAGLYGGRVDTLMMRIVDVILVVPLLVLVTAPGPPGGRSRWSSRCSGGP